MHNISGVIPAMVTPMNDDGSIDYQSFRNLVDWQIEQGVHALAPAATTGESPTLTHQEHQKILEVCIEQTQKRVPVIAATGSNCTREAIQLSQHAEKNHADALLVITPYYNKPTQKGILQHFTAISQSVSLPIIIYNVPGRTAVDIDIETMVEIAKLKNIVGVKDATAQLDRVLQYQQNIKKDFIQLSGDDATTLAYIAQGGHGCISVTANIATKKCVEMFNAIKNEQYQKAKNINYKLFSLNQALFLETSPSPVKYALSLIGMCKNNVRLPLVTVEAETQDKIQKAMKILGII